MDDLRDELAALVADMTGVLDSLRGQGVVVVPRAPVDPRRAEQEPRGRSGPTEATPSRSIPLPVSPPRAPTMAPPTPAPRSPALAPAASAPRSPSPAPPPPPPPRAAAPQSPDEPAPEPASGGLLGRWAAQLTGPEERLRRVQEGMAAGCAGCGEPPVLGTGGVRSGMALLYDAGSAADEAVLANMLVRVVGVEPADVLRFQPRACHACADAVTAQLDAVRPRVVLALGPLARGLLFGEPGAWVRLGAWSAIGTWHPAELATDPARKRVAFEVLKGVAARR